MNINEVKKYFLNEEEIDQLLDKMRTASLSTMGTKGYPYTIPAHYIYNNKKLYALCMLDNTRIESLKENNSVCCNIYRINSNAFKEENLSDAKYENIMLLGNAKIIENNKLKKDISKKITRKYLNNEIPDKNIEENVMNSTAIIEVSIYEKTGRVYI